MENQLENLGPVVAKPWIIYALVDPRDPGAIRYVGKAKDASKRLNEHLAEARTSKREDHRLHWLRKLASCSVEPIVAILETGKGDGWKEAERKWIKHFRDMGSRLVNGTDGGEGVDLTPEVQAKKLAAMHSPEYRAKQSAAITGKKRSLETRTRMSAAQKGNQKNLGHLLSPQTKAKIGAANSGKHPSPETRAKMSAARKGNQNHLGHHHTEEVRAKMSAAHKAYWAKKKAGQGPAL